MSIAPREAKCSMAPATRAGHWRLGQRWSDSPSGRTSARVAHRAVGREHPLGPALLRPLGQHRADDLGDDVAGLAHDDGVAGAHVLGLHLVLVVQGGRRRRWSRRRRPARACANGVARPVRPIDTWMSLSSGRALLGRELEGDRPAGRLGGEPELARGWPGRRPSRPRRRSRSRGRGGAPASGRQRAYTSSSVGEPLDLGVDREPEVAEEVERVVVGGQVGTALDLAELVAPEGELAATR